MTHSDRRRSGLLIPLFACPSSTSWGIGDIGDILALARWLHGAGQCVLQLLPINEMAEGQQSPYSAMSAMAIDPIYIRVTDVPEYSALGGDAQLTDEEHRELTRLRESTSVDYPAVRELKQRALAAAFRHFLNHEWRRDTDRARDLRQFMDRERWWLDDYALFRALHERERRSWVEWPAALRDRNPDALAQARQELADEVLYREYLQWIADGQWRQARALANGIGVALYGDLPFMVDGHSADVWARQSDFRLDASVGVPPDAFSATGQDWGMPAYRWEVIARGDFQWLRDRARRSAALYDGYRIDHLVGFFRTYSRPRDGGAPSFEPSSEPEQIALGERVMAVFREPGSEIFAEDLGVVPDFVRELLARLHIAGFRVFRWEREWHVEGQPFREPVNYPPVSVATTGTHDTEPMRIWWETAPDAEKAAVANLRTVEQVARGANVIESPYNPDVRDALLEALFASGSNLLLFPIQDVFGWYDRINVPATVGDSNWTYRLPWLVDSLDEQPAARERKTQLRTWAERYGRF